MPATRNHGNINFPTVEGVRAFADEALNDGHRPEWVYVLESKVFEHFIVPHVTLV